MLPVFAPCDLKHKLNFLFGELGLPQSWTETMVGLKKQSKRMTTKKRVKIERKVKEHNRKKRKEARKNPKKGKKKDPGVPSSLPFKEIILKEFEQTKKQAEEERAKKREMLKKKRQKSRESLQNKNRNLTDFVADAEKRQAEYEKKQGKVKTDDLKSYQSASMETSRQTYVKEFRKVVEAADVVLEVLDARDPLGTRCQELESIVLASAASKKLVLILNKIDLIPKENAEEWVKYLRNEFPTVAFKASTQTQNDHLSQRKMQLSSLTESLSRSSHCLGADVLMKLLANYCRNKDIKTSIRVGIVGFPNTGKSSIINSLKRSKACTVGAMPGITRAMQEVILDKHIRLLDSPGVVMETGQSPVTAVLRNVVRLESIEDPEGPVEHILSRCGKEQMMLQYNLPDFSNVDEFLTLLAKRQGRLKKGGIPDCSKAARAVLQDWTSGRINYHTQPPEDRSTLSVSICSELKEAFDINSATLSGLPSKSGRSPLLVDSLGPVSGIVDPASLPAEDMEDEEDNEEEMEEEEDAKDIKADTMNPIVTVKQKGKGSESCEEKVTVLQANKDRKKAFKQMKKNRKRADALAGTLSSAMETAFNVGLGDDDSDDDL